MTAGWSPPSCKHVILDPSMSKQPKTLVPWEDCKWSLAKIWLVGVGVAFIMMLFLTAIGRFKIGSQTKLDPDLQEWSVLLPNPEQEAWTWFISTLMPSMSLIVGALLSNLGTRAPGREKLVESRQFRLAYGTSSFYLFVVFITLVLCLAGDNLAVGFLKSSTLWLAPCQALNGVVLSIFFVRAAPSEGVSPG